MTEDRKKEQRERRQNKSDRNVYNKGLLGRMKETKKMYKERKMAKGKNNRKKQIITKEKKETNK